mmetsp:Transcript_21455/g.68372  ORF Transcript_21455/g.68372 Transcript_21455/m.68372 type:complete len:247 (+) Transcript_21455:485-1225(+)
MRQHVLVNVERLAPHKRAHAGGDLEDEHAERPPVHAVRVKLAENDLRAHVVGRPANRVGPLRLLRQPEIGDARVAPFAQKDVLRLEVTVQDAARMDGVQCLNHRRDVKLGVALGQSRLLLLAEHRVHVTPVEQLHEEVDVSVVVERAEKLHQERAVRERAELGHSVPLVLHHLGPAVALNVVTGQHLERHVLGERVALQRALVALVLTHQVHTPKRPLAKPCHRLEVVERDVVARQGNILPLIWHG